MKNIIEKSRSSSKCRFQEISKGFIPKALKPCIYVKTSNGSYIHPDKYEFLIYRLLMQCLEAGDIYCRDSVRFRSFDDDLISPKDWQQKDKVLKQLDIHALRRPIEDRLYTLEQQLEEKIAAVNQRIQTGDNVHLRVIGQGNRKRWTLPYVRQEDTMNHSFFEPLTRTALTRSTLSCYTFSAINSHHATRIFAAD